MFEVTEDLKRKMILAIRAAHGKEAHTAFIPLADGSTLIMSAESPGLTTWKLIGESDLFGAPGVEDVTADIAEAMADDMGWVKYLKRGGV